MDGLPHLRQFRLALAALLASGAMASAEEPSFEQQVRPIFKAYCFECHGGGQELAGKLDLRLRHFAEKGGESGPALIATKPAESLLITRLKAGEMPPGEKKVPPEQIAIIEHWI